MIRSFVFAAIFSAAVWAQAPVLNGKFILAEEGVASATLGILTFDAAGNVSGTEYLQAAGLNQSVSVTGTYTSAADGSGTLTLNTQVPTEDGPMPAVSAVYEFFRAKGGGFAAIRRDTAAATIAAILPAASGAGSSGSYILTHEGCSASGQSVASIGVFSMKADGTLQGRLVVKQNGASEAKLVEGSYAADPSGFGYLKLFTPSAADEDGVVVMETSSYVFLTSSEGEWFALRTGNSVLGLARIEPAR